MVLQTLNSRPNNYLISIQRRLDRQPVHGYVYSDAGPTWEPAKRMGLALLQESVCWTTATAISLTPRLQPGVRGRYFSHEPFQRFRATVNR